MFTGIIRNLGTIYNIEIIDNILTLDVEISFENEVFHKGDSICINGICLTVVKMVESIYTFEVMQETINKTTISLWKKGDIVNVETSIKNSEYHFDGYITTGHIDGTCTLKNKITQKDKTTEFVFECNSNLMQFILYKGSIAIDGVSLTIAKVYDQLFSVCIIPHTYDHTIFKNYLVDIKCNIEVDIQLKNKEFYAIEHLIGSSILSDSHAMELANKLSLRGKWSCQPNPWVGCLVVKDNIIVGTGYHKKAGTEHAEVIAIKEAIKEVYEGENLTLYVTLEPCCHHGRTPPCVDLILSTQSIKKVVIGVLDTDERVARKGMKKLKENGVECILLNHKSVKESLEPYLYSRNNKKPYIILKMAMTLDGKCCAEDKTSKWITPKEARLDSHKTIREEVQCILTTAETILNDNPRFVCDTNKEKELFVAVLDKHNKLKEFFLKPNFKVFTNKDIEEVIDTLYKEYNIISILYEGGSVVFTKLINKGLWNEVVLYTSSTFLGTKGRSIYTDDKGENISELQQIGQVKNIKKIGNCVRTSIVKKHFYKIVGEVVHGYKRGSKILGYPTANVEPSKVDFSELKEGIYYGTTKLHSKEYKSVMSVGKNPTFGTETNSFETYLIDYKDEDFYGEEIEVNIKGYIRESKKCETIKELINWIEGDIDYCLSKS